MHGPMKKKPGPLEARLRTVALSYPEAREEFPWGERAFKVAGKTFVFLSSDADGVQMAVKLPESRDVALALPFTEPTHYGLGKSGWVTAKLRADDDAPMWLLEGWIDESYRTIAPRKLAAQAGQRLPRAAAPAPRRAAGKAKGTVRKPGKRRSAGPGTKATSTRRRK